MLRCCHAIKKCCCCCCRFCWLHVHFSFAFFHFTTPFSVLWQIKSQGHLENFSQNILERCLLFHPSLFFTHSLNTHSWREIDRRKGEMRKRATARECAFHTYAMSKNNKRHQPNHTKQRDRTDVCRCCRCRCRYRRRCVTAIRCLAPFYYVFNFLPSRFLRLTHRLLFPSGSSGGNGNNSGNFFFFLQIHTQTNASSLLFFSFFFAHNSLLKSCWLHSELRLLCVARHTNKFSFYNFSHLLKCNDSMA